MTRDADPGRNTPEPVICPNGHANRPGTRICAVCRALIPPAAASPAPPAAAPPLRRPTATVDDSRLLVVLLLLLALTAATIVLAFVYFYPIRHGPDYLATAAVVTLPAGESGVVALATATPPSATVAPPSPTSPPPAATADPDAPPTPVATITPLSTVVGVILAPTAEATPAVGVNLIQNGDFGQDWVNGWERAGDSLNGAQAVEVRPSSGDPPRPLLAMSKTGAGALRVVQHVALTGPADELVFRGQLRLTGAPPTAGNEGRAALLLLYENEAGETLGASVWLDGSATTSSLWGSHLPPFGPTTAPRIQAAEWQTVEIALAREFTDRLPAIDPAAVRRVTIVLTLASSDGCPPDACAAELGAAALSLAAGELAP